MEANSSVNLGVKRHAKPLASNGPLFPLEERIQRAIGRIAESDCPVLIVGENGVGKRSIAAQIHSHSRRARSAYTEIHCAETDAQAIRSAFSTSGTVYLMEVGDLSLPLQNLIVDLYFHSEPAQTSRLLCGTCRELFEAVRTSWMKEDFYYLISTITLQISPLRCRKSEILSIADHLLAQYSKQFNRPRPVLPEEIAGFLLEHTWPDNLPELETAIKTFVAIGNQAITLAALKATASAVKLDSHRKPLSLKDATRAASTQIEHRLISEVLAATGGNRKRAADNLGISYKTLLYKLKQVDAKYQPASKWNGVAL